MASTLQVSPHHARVLRVALVGSLSPFLSEALKRYPVSVVPLDNSTRLDAVILLPGAEVDRVYGQMMSGGHMLAAVLDLSGSDSRRADFTAATAGPDSLARGIETALEIHDRRSAFADIPANEDRLGLTALALSVTRQRAIEPQLNPARPAMFDYPLLEGIPDQRSILETLASAKLLKRQFHDRIYLCGGCNGSRMLARDVCPTCRSADLEEETLIHHYRCGEQAPKSRFLKGDELTCPKCDRMLRHFGVDYDAPGPVFFCRSCQKTSPEPEVFFLCGDCQSLTRGLDAETTDWFSYSPTEVAHTALGEGRLPGIHLENFLNGLPGWRTPRDFALTLDLTHRVSARYKRPYCLLQLDTAATAEAIAEGGMAAQAKIQKLMVELVRQAVRETDFFAAIDKRLLLLLPETSAEKCNVLMERLQTRAAEVLGARVKLTVRLSDDQVPLLIEQLSK